MISACEARRNRYNADSLENRQRFGDERMKRGDVIQAVKFTLFSISAGLVQVASFALFHDVLHFSQYWFSYLPSLVLSVLWNFTFNPGV